MGFGTLFFGPSDAHYLEEINGMLGIPTGNLWTGGHSALQNYDYPNPIWQTAIAH